MSKFHLIEIIYKDGKPIHESNIILTKKEAFGKNKKKCKGGRK